MNTFKCFCWLLGCLILPGLHGLPQLRAQEAATGASLILNGDFVDDGAHWDVTGTAFKPVEATVAAKRALRFDVAPLPDAKPWSVLFTQAVAPALKAGEPVSLRFWARADAPAKIAGMLEQNAAPYDKIVEGEADLTTEWKPFDWSGKVPRDFEAGSTRLTFHLGYGAAKIELAGVQLEATARAPIDEAKPQNAPVSLLENGDWSAPFEANWTTVGAVKTEVVPAKIGTYEQALRVSADVPATANPWEFQVRQTVKVAVPRESAVTLRAFLRAPQGPAQARVAMVFEQTETPNDKVIYQTVKLTKEWQEFRFAGTTNAALAAGESRVVFFVGFPGENIEIAGVRAQSYGRAPLAKFDQTLTPIDYWNGAPHDDAWKIAALQRIEKIRKADFRVRVVDAANQPVPGASVKIEMTRQAFRWGVAGKAERLVDTVNPDNLRFQAEVKRLFNTFTFENDLKWQESPPDLERLRMVDRASGWLQANGIEARGHNLLWAGPRHLPAGILDLPAPELTEKVRAHTLDYARRYRGQVYVWDVVNEATDNTDLWDKIGWDNFANAYKWAREGDPNALLAYNDYNISDLTGERGHRAQVLARVKTLLDAGAPLDIIGDQAHMEAPLTPIPTFLKGLDEVAALGKPIEITEFDLSVKDDKVHGDYVRDILIAAFSHPAVVGFIQWGLWEGDQWLSASGAAMMRADWNKRPAQQYYEDLVLNQWWTRAAGTTDKTGQYQTRGFLGDYQVSATARGKSASAKVSLAKGGQSLTLVLS